MKNLLKSATNLVGKLSIAAILFAVSLEARAQNLNLPLGVAVDANSNIYVANLLGAVTVYGPNFGKKTVITQGVDAPASVAIGPDGTIYVANNGANSITTYSKNNFAQQSLTFSAPLPVQVVVGTYSEVYVVQSNGTVSMFDPLGEPRAQVTAANTQTLAINQKIAQFYVANPGSSPSALEYDAFTIDIAANLNGFVAGTPDTNFLPARAVANSKTGITWITDFVNQHVLQEDTTGNVVIKITPVSPPYGIALDTNKQRLFVTEPEANQVEVFSLATLQRVGLLK